MKVFIYITLFFTSFVNAFGEDTNCISAGLNEDRFFQASVGEVIKISRVKISKQAQNRELEELISECFNVEKVSKRVLGRAKWEELSKAQQENFIKEYEIYFVSVFSDTVLASVQGVQSYSFRKANIENNYQINFVSSNKEKKELSIILVVEKMGNLLKIIDGKFAEVSIVASQRQMFDRLYDENQNVIKEFKAANYINKVK